MKTKKTAPVAPSYTIEDVYNMLMELIEPELTTYNIEHLDEMYEGEDEKEKKMRGERYARAFLALHNVFSSMTGAMKRGILDIKTDFIKEMESKALKEEKKKIKDIEKSISEE